MEYKKFIEEFKATNSERAKREMVKKHIKETYINYENKTAVCVGIVNNTWSETIEDKTIAKKNSPMQYIFFIMKLVELYTDIEFDNIFDAYNELNRAGVFEILFVPSSNDDSVIGQKEYNEFKAILDMCNGDYYENVRSVPSIIDMNLQNLGVVLNMILDIVKDIKPEN